MDESPQGAFLPGETPIAGKKQNDTRDGLDIEGQDPESVGSYAEQFTRGLAMIYAAHEALRLDADRYVAVWDQLSSKQRTALRKIISESPA